MKRNMEKILATASLIVALVLIIILVITVFGGIKFEEFENKLVRGLIITLGVVYLLLAAGSLSLIFTSNDIAKEIVIRSKQGGSARVSVGVVKKLVKSTCTDIKGVACNKISIYTNDFGVHLKVAIRVTNKDVEEAEVYVRTAIEEEIMGTLGFRFNSIEIKVTALKPKFVLDKAAVEEKSAERLKTMRDEETSPAADTADAAASVVDYENEIIVPAAEAVPAEEVLEAETEAETDAADAQIIPEATDNE